MRQAFKCECGAVLLNPFGWGDAALMREADRLPRTYDIMDVPTMARMLFLIYRGLRPDASDPLVWRKHDDGRALLLEMAS